MKRYRKDLAIAVALFAANLLVLGPFLFTEYSSQPWNNSYVYMAISRMFRDHPWTWNRLQYAGAPFHYLYPPLFHVLTAAVPLVSIGRAFHIVTACGYALVPACLYVLAYRLFQFRPVAALAAIAYSVFPSPVYYFLPTWKNLAAPYGNAPYGFVAMIGYEEAAHAFALAFTLLAIASAWANRWILAAIIASLVFLTNWPALLGLLMAFAALALARVRDFGIAPALLRVGGVVGTAYGLSAFWMTPGSFVSSTLLNRIVIRHINGPAPWNATATLILAGALVLIAFSFWRPIPPAFSFLLIWIAMAGAVVACFSIAGTWLVPMPNRYMLELNAASVLLLAGLVTLASRARYPILVGLVVFGLIVSFGFLRQAWRAQPRSVDPRTLVTSQISAWLQAHAAHQRVLASGELDSTLNLWSDVPQVGGTGQDVSNFLMFAAQRQVIFGCSSNARHISDLWLEALDAGYVVMHRSNSQEAYHWFVQQSDFNGQPIAWDDQAGDIIYHIPTHEEAVIVDLPALASLPTLHSTADVQFLEAYVRWAAGKRPAPVHWDADDRVTILAKLAPGEAVLLKSNYDPGWRVSGDGEISADPLGFLIIHRASGPQPLTLRFGASWEAWLGRALTLVTILLLAARVPGWCVAAVALGPAVAAYAVLIHAAPRTAQVAEEAFRRLQPPLINAGGVVDSETGQGPPFRPGRILSMYGSNFGSARESTAVWIDGRQVPPLFHDPHFINLRLPIDSPSKFEISVEVNGCRGNAFAFDRR